MDKNETLLYKNMLVDAENAFKLLIGLRITVSSNEGLINYIDTFSWGKHTMHAQSLHLSKEEEIIALAALEHCTIYTLVTQIDTTLQKFFNGRNIDRFKHQNTNISSAAWISRLIRNAFTHNPLNPIWITYNECETKKYTVDDIIFLDTTELNGKKVKREDYGGPLALIRLSEYVRNMVLEINS